MVDRLPPAEPYTPAEVEAAPSGINPLAILSRRWPLVVAGLVVGGLIGVLVQITSTPMYLSSAQVLVIRSVDQRSAGGEARSAVIDDYVGAQLAIIKSEQVRRASAKVLRALPVNTPLPEDDGAVAEMIRVGLVVARDKEAGASSNTIGNGIVILTFRWADPADAKLFLDAVIKAYQAQLVSVYKGATEEQIASQRRGIDAIKAGLKTANEQRIKLDGELQGITLEDIASVRGRLTEEKNKLNVLDGLIIESENALALVDAAKGKDARDRQAVLTQLTGVANKALESATNPGLEQQLRSLKFKRESRAQQLGPDHPEIQALDAEVKFLADEVAVLNPADPTGRVDELAAIGLKLKFDLATKKKQAAALNQALAKDEETLKRAGAVNSQIDGVKLAIDSANRSLNEAQAKLTQVEATSVGGGYTAQPITPPAAGGKVAPVLVQSVLFGLVFGLFLGAGGVALAEVQDKSFKSPAEIRRRLGVPVIGHVPLFRDAPADAGTPAGVEKALVTALRPKSVESESYRGVRTQLYFSTQGRGHQVIQVTSPNPGDGKSTLAANLAVSIAQSGKRTVLIDCDFRKPQVHKIFGLGKVEYGLASVVAGLAPIAKALRRSPVDNLDLMACGPRPENPAELLTSPRFQQTLADLRDAYDFVVVDTPPVLAVSDPTAVAPRVDGIILVFRMTKYARPAAERTREQLGAIGANILGVVVNGGGGGMAAGYDGYNYGTGKGYKYTDYEYAEHYTAADEADDVTPPPVTR